MSLPLSEPWALPLRPEQGTQRCHRGNDREPLECASGVPPAPVCPAGWGRWGAQERSLLGQMVLLAVGTETLGRVRAGGGVCFQERLAFRKPGSVP